MCLTTLPTPPTYLTPPQPVCLHSFGSNFRFNKRSYSLDKGLSTSWWPLWGWLRGKFELYGISHLACGFQYGVWCCWRFFIWSFWLTILGLWQEDSSSYSFIHAGQICFADGSLWFWVLWNSSFLSRKKACHGLALRSFVFLSSLRRLDWLAWGDFLFLCWGWFSQSFFQWVKVVAEVKSFSRNGLNFGSSMVSIYLVLRSFLISLQQVSLWLVIKGFFWLVGSCFLVF